MTKLQQYLKEQTDPIITCTQLAKKWKVHPSLITMWKVGARKPAKWHLKTISAETGIKIEDLL